MPSAATWMDRARDQLAIAAFAGVAAFIRLQRERAGDRD
jgi:hypothetical protein